MKSIFSLGLVATLLIAQSSLACRSFLLENSDDGPVMAKSFDFDLSGGQALINPRGVSKSAMLTFIPMSKQDTSPLVTRWISKYGSVTFTQIGPNFPFGGMNEAKLAGEVLWLTESSYASPIGGSKTWINESQFLQYILDTSKNIDEVIENSGKVDITKLFAPIHYLFCDASKECVAIEVLKGEKQFTRITNASEKFIENLPYRDMIAGQQGRVLPIFQRQDLQKKFSVADTFNVLDQVKTSGWTRWQMVYSLGAGAISYRGVNGYGEGKAINNVKFASAMFECDKTKSGVGIFKASDIESNEAKFHDFTADDFSANLKNFSKLMSVVWLLKGPALDNMTSNRCL